MQAQPGRVPTIEIVHPDGIDKGSIFVNESDFDAAVHTKWSERKPEPKKPTSEDA